MNLIEHNLIFSRNPTIGAVTTGYYEHHSINLYFEALFLLYGNMWYQREKKLLKSKKATSFFFLSGGQFSFISRLLLSTRLFLRRLGIKHDSVNSRHTPERWKMSPSPCQNSEWNENIASGGQMSRVLNTPICPSEICRTTYDLPLSFRRSCVKKKYTDRQEAGGAGGKWIRFSYTQIFTLPSDQREKEHTHAQINKIMRHEFVRAVDWNFVSW